MTRVALFVTCIVDMLFPAAGEASLDLLDRHGVSAEFPESQTCCGQPAFNSGFTADARAVAERFLDVFEPFDRIVTPSGSCAAMIRHYYPQLFHDTSRATTAQRLAASTFELTAYLADERGVTDIGSTLPRPVRATLHDACHGLRGLNLHAQPRKLLATVKNLTLTEMQGADQCCGFGGLFAVKMSDISGAMLKDKLACIDAADADVVITGDASCMMHMNGGLSRTGSRKRVVHVAEALAGRI
jgi:L-lactate dehydrogenase complex protein LldE